MTRGIMVRLALLGTIVVVMFGVFELGLRFAGGSEAAPAFQKLFMEDPLIGYRLRPGASTRFTTAEFDTDISINALGVRGHELPPKREGERRIVILGDSVVLAVQVPLAETFCALLENGLNRRTPDRGTPYTVVNAGVQGYGPVQEWLLAKDLLPKVDPDVVVVALSVWHDAVDAANAEWRLRSADQGRDTRGAPGNGVVSGPDAYTILRRIVRRSMVLQILRQRALNLAGWFGRAPQLSPFLATYLPEEPPNITQGLAVMRACLQEIDRAARAQGARLAVILLPARFQIDDDEWERVQQMARESGKTVDRDIANLRFRRTLFRETFPVFDTLDALRAHPRRRDLFFKQTAHLTPAGHRAMADVIGTFLLAEGLIPETAIGNSGTR